MMNREIKQSMRRFVVITDPHIKAVKNYTVYAEGEQLESDTDYLSMGIFSLQSDPIENFTSIWVKKYNGLPFVGDCWPGKSVYIDWLNSNAQEFWIKQMSFEKFKPTNPRYHFWIDMNEPTVFK